MAKPYEPEILSGTGAGRAREPEPLSGRSPLEIIRDIANNIQAIVRAEIELARAEVMEKVRHAGKAGILIAAGAVVGLYGAAFLLVCVYNALSLGTPPWLSALVIGVVLVVTAAVLYAAGRRKFQQLNPVPSRTVDSVREDVAWLRDRMK